jgi:hypothetical protein
MSMDTFICPCFFLLISILTNFIKRHDNFIHYDQGLLFACIWGGGKFIDLFDGKIYIIFIPCKQFHILILLRF